MNDGSQSIARHRTLLVALVAVLIGACAHPRPVAVMPASVRPERQPSEPARSASQVDSEAVKSYRKAADLGDATAMFNLGVSYADGEGVAKDDA